MTINVTKLIEVVNADEGTTKTTVLNHDVSLSGLTEDLAPYPRNAYGEMTCKPEHVNLKLTEAATGMLSTDNFPDLLRFGVQFDALSSFNETPTVYERLVRTRPSNKQQEEYQDDEGIGLLPIVAEGQPYQDGAVSLGPGTIIRNHKRGMLIPVTMEMQMFDQLGKVRETAASLGRAARLTREMAVMDVLTTTTNYQVKNNNTLGGANQEDLDFTPTNLNIALARMTTQRDRTSGTMLGVMPSILVVGPLLERFARMLIGSPQLNRQGGPTTSEVYGAGTNNPFFGVVTQIIVSPYFSSSYDWALLDPSKAIYFQPVQNLQVLVEGANMASETWLTRDIIRYKVMDYWGVGMRDDRYAFLSNNTTAPAAS